MTRTRGILIDRPERSQGVTAGLSSEPPGRSPSWARVAGWNAWTSRTADAPATARASHVRGLFMGTLDGSHKGLRGAGKGGDRDGFPFPSIVARRTARGRLDSARARNNVRIR